jgi:truncated hemoglobin YjbI
MDIWVTRRNVCLEQTPFDRIGGEAKMNDFVGDFLKNIEENGNLSSHFASRTDSLKEGYKKTLGEYLKGNIKIEKVPDGSMADLHHGISISKSRADDWIQCLHQTLRQYGIKGEDTEIMLDKIRAKAYEMVNAAN